MRAHAASRTRRRAASRPSRPGSVRRTAVTGALAAVLSVAAAGSAAALSPASLRLVGGTAVPTINSFPFQVALFIQATGGPLGQSTLAFCGGVIIDPTQVVTAAHCVTDEVSGTPVAPLAVTALAGTATLTPAIPTAPVASAIAVDPRYNPDTADYDVAVVTLSTPLYTGTPRADGTVTVAPIALITPDLAARFANPSILPAEPVIISGWGETSPLAVGARDPAPSLPAQLQAAQTHLVSDATCASQYAGLGSIGVPAITARMLCAGEPGGGIDACSGDSGGPLVVDVDNPAAAPGDYVLAGLIDFGAGCAQAGFPGVYVRLATPEITAFINQQAQAQGQSLTTPPAPVGVAPPRRLVSTGGTARLAATSGRVTAHQAPVAVRCLIAACTGTLTLRTSTTVGLAHFAIDANSTARIRVRITPRGQRELDRHQHRLRTRAILRTTGSAGSQRSFTLTD